MTEENKKIRYVSIAEVKNILSKISKNRPELIYEQKIAFEHAQKFAKLPVKKTKSLINELKKMDYLTEKLVYKIADLLPTREEDVKTIFAKEKVALDDEKIKKIIETVGKYYVE